MSIASNLRDTVLADSFETAELVNAYEQMELVYTGILEAMGMVSKVQDSIGNSADLKISSSSNLTSSFRYK